MSLEVFLQNCAGVVLYTANLIGLVTPQFQHYHKIFNATRNPPTRATSDDDDVNALNRSLRVGNYYHHNTTRDPALDATLTSNRYWLCNTPTKILLLCSCLIAYPVAVLFVKSTSDVVVASPASRTSYFNLFVFITLYFHYALMFVVCTMVALRNRLAFTHALIELYSLIHSIASHQRNNINHMDATGLPERGSPEGGWKCHPITMTATRSWMRARSIDLGLKCGLLGLVFICLCWLSINLPILTEDNWITILGPSLILILPTAMLLLLSTTFYALALALECVLLTMNDWLRVQCMQVRQSAQEVGQRRTNNKLWQLSICDNVDMIIQYYSRTLQLLKKLNNFQAQPVLLIVLNCFFNIAVQSFSIYMTFAAVAKTTTHTVAPNMNNNNNGSIRMQDEGIIHISTSTDSAAGSGIKWNGQRVTGEGHSELEEDGDTWGGPKESAQTVAHLYIIAVNSVYILINYCELWATVRASTVHKAAVSITLYVGLGHSGTSSRVGVAPSRE